MALKGKLTPRSAGLKIYGRMPQPISQRVVRLAMPSFTLGAMPIITRPDGRLLLVRHSYMSGWGFPGGLVNRRERPEVAVAREAREEVNLRIQLIGEPAVTVDPFKQVIRVIYAAVPAAGASPSDVHPASEEIEEVAWFDPARLPHLAPEANEALTTLRRARGNERWPVDRRD